MFHPIPAHLYDEYFAVYSSDRSAYNIQELFIPVHNNPDLKLHTIIKYYSPPDQNVDEQSNSKNTYLLYSHGNAGNIFGRTDIVETISNELKCNVVVYDYRGFGKSGYSNMSNLLNTHRNKAVPTEHGVYGDVLTMWLYLTTEMGIAPENIILYGESLGCAISTWLIKHIARENGQRPHSVILCSGFCSLKREVDDKAGPMVSWLVDDDVFPTKRNLEDGLQTLKEKGIELFKTFVLHSPTDEVIRIENGVQNSRVENGQFYQIYGGHCSHRFGDVLSKIASDNGHNENN
jgi:pimeloyl-ACP methyl ester carboxylesterase